LVEYIKPCALLLRIEVKRKQVQDILFRMIAVVIASVMGTIGAGTIIGVELWKSASMAAILGVAVVLEALARAYIVDGKLDDAEINESFGKANGKK
jgi:type IV secretory pathway TrbD component